jgi:hypothetical protein
LINNILETENNFVYYFNSIITKGKKDNTYKFALARFLIEYSNRLDNADIENKIKNNTFERIQFSTIAESFLKYYWHQICKYKIRQNYHIDKPPLIVQIIHEVFGKEYIPDSFKGMDPGIIRYAENLITKKCFAEVIPRFQNIPEGTKISLTKIFYEYDNYSISLRPEAISFFKKNYSLLLKAVILEWAKFLEKINIGLPRLISKIESEEFKRYNLAKYQIVLKKHFDKCFYCNNSLPKERTTVHVDHFIPWSYIYEDELWNLVLACGQCNIRKHSSLPQEEYVKKLVERNNEYCDKIEELRKSIIRLEVEHKQEYAIKKYYQNCLDYGFTKVT